MKGEFSKSNIHLLKSFRSANMERSTTDGKPKPRKRNFSLKAGEERAKFRLTWLSVQKKLCFTVYEFVLLKDILRFKESHASTS